MVQKITQANPGDNLVDIVDYVVNNTDYFVAVVVQLRDLSTGSIVADDSHYEAIPGPVTGSLPSQAQAVSMPSNPLYLQIELVEIGPAGSGTILDRRALQPITLPGFPSSPGGNALLIVGGVAAVSLAAAGIYLLTRKKG